MSSTGAVFNTRWASGQHIGSARPVMLVEVRKGKFQRRWDRWQGEEVNADIPGETARRPWQAFWTPTSAYRPLPNVLDCSIDQDFDQNGLAVATINVENTLLREAQGPLAQLYHLADRGALAPWRGYWGGYAQGAKPANEWYDLLTHHSQIRVWQGYGDALEVVFTGLIESVDPVTTPDRITLTVRDFGGPTLVDQHIFGYNDGPRVPEPAVFVAKGALVGKGEPVGYDASASSHRDGDLPRFVLDTDPNTNWLSYNRDTENDTVWVQVRVPRGKYQSIYLHPHYRGMTVWLGVYAHSTGLGGRSCQVDDEDIDDGWIDLGDDGGTVPGSSDGGWPYIATWKNVPDKLQELKLGMTLDLGDASIFRIGLRKLQPIHARSNQVTGQNPDDPGRPVLAYRGGIARLQPIKRNLPATSKTKKVGRTAKASSVHDPIDGQHYDPKFVLDNKTSTRWVSRNRGSADVTEWLEIHLPQATYESFRMFPAHGHYDIYVGIYAKPRVKGGLKAEWNWGGIPKYHMTYDVKPPKVDGKEIPTGWVDLRELTMWGAGNVPPGFGTVPGDDNGGWKYVAHYQDADLPSKGETFRLGHKYELGEGSILRVGFRNLHAEGGGVYRAAVKALHGLTKSGVEQPKKVKPSPAKIEVGDLSDIVRCVLRWAGFKEWEIENTGIDPDVISSKQLEFNRQSSFMDVIAKVQEITGYVFFMDRPTSADDSIGVPIFRQGQVLKNVTGIPVVRDSDLLTGVQAHVTEEPLAHIIRIRGKASKSGKKLGSDHTRRFMSNYRPPWARNGRLAHVLKHVTLDEFSLSSQREVDIYARLYAIRQALASATATIEVPGTPAFTLDDHIALVDNGTGFNTRLYVTNRNSTFTTGKQTSFKTSLGGALLDTPDFLQTLADLLAILPKGENGYVDLTSAFALLGDEEGL